MLLLRRIVFLSVIALMAVFIFQNQENLGRPLDFQFLHWSSSLVLGFWILFSFLAGAALFALIDAWKSMLLRRGIEQRDRRITQLETDLAEARKAPEPQTPGVPDKAE